MPNTHLHYRPNTSIGICIIDPPTCSCLIYYTAIRQYSTPPWVYPVPLQSLWVNLYLAPYAPTPVPNLLILIFILCQNDFNIHTMPKYEVP